MDDLTDRLVISLDPSPGTRELVSRRVVEFAAEIDDAEILTAVLDAMENPEGLRARDLAERAGLTYKQVNYWTAQGHLLPNPRAPGAGSGTQYVYPAASVTKARVMGSLVGLFSMNPERASTLADRIVADGSVGGFRLTWDHVS